MPKISVVLPVHNAVLSIARAVESILCQSLRDIELIVVDDGSSDGTAEVVGAYSDERLRLVSTEHQGVASAANLGTELATSALIARMDADDFSQPHRLQTQYEYLVDNDLDVVGCQVRILDEEGIAVESLQRYQRWINEETLSESKILAFRFVEFPLVNPTILARRSYFELGFHTDDFPEDYDLMLRAAECGFRFGKVAVHLFDWSDHGERLTRTDSRYSQDAFMQCRRQHLLVGPLAGVREVDLWGVGQTGKPWMRWLQSKDVTVRRAYDISPKRIGKQIHGVRVDNPDDAPGADGTPLVVAIGADSTKNVVLPQLESLGYFVGKDAWLVA